MKIHYPFISKVDGDVHQSARILVTSVFFMWGLSYGLLEVLNKHFQETLGITKAQSGMLQMAYFGAYFLMAFPAAKFMQRAGYKNGLVLGLSLFAVGGLLFIPASSYGQFWPFLGSLFVLACGIACLETAANPYMTLLGNKDSASKRLNLAQSFCALGAFVGPLLGGIVLFNEVIDQTLHFDSTRLIYAGLAFVAICIAIYLKSSTALIEPRHSDESDHKHIPFSSGLQFKFGVVAMFFYVAAQVGVGTFFVNYVTEYGDNLSSKQGAFLLSLSMFFLMAGRFLSTWLMKYVNPNWLLLCYSLVSMFLCALVIIGWENISIVALVCIFFCMSIMFPTIFSTAIENLGVHTKYGASILMMSVVGGAITPYMMGYIADNVETKIAYVIPFICFLVVFLYSHFLVSKINLPDKLPE